VIDWALRVAWAGLALALLALSVMRGVGVALPAAATLPGTVERRAWLPVPVLAGLFALGQMAAVPALPLAPKEAGVGLALAGLLAPRWPRRPWRRRGEAWRRAGAAAGGPPAGRDSGRWWVALAGAAAMLLLFAAAWVEQAVGGRSDAADGLMVGPAAWCIRLAWSGAAFGLLALAGRRSQGRLLEARAAGEVRAAGAAARAWTLPEGGAGVGAGPARADRAAPETAPGRWAVLAVCLLGAGAALADNAWAALPLLAAGGGTAALFGDRQRRGRGSVLAVTAALAALAGAAVWETADRARLAIYDAGSLLDRLAPPPRTDLAALDAELGVYFGHLDFNALAARSPVGLDRRDLGYALWRGSPLARPNTLSALVVRSGGALVSSFAFDLPLDGEGGIDGDRLRALTLPGWEVVAGEVAVTLGDGSPGTVRYWLLPRPGFHIEDHRRLVNITVGLLRGGNPQPAPVEELAAPGLFAVYAAPDGRAALSPWAERPPLAARLRRPHAVRAEVSTPAGHARAYVRPQPRGDGWEAVYLPDEAPLDAVERAANWAVGLLLLLACAAPPAALLALPRAAFRELLRRTVRSYSRRLLIVYTVLLLLPLVLLNALLVRSVERDMLGHQSSAGQAALASAEQLLREEIRTLPVGFVFDPATFDPKLTAISAVVRRPVNLYGNSRLSASSEHELFTAGLLPTRLPGGVYSSLALGDRNLYSLVNHAADVPYLELYAPLRLTGDDPGGEPRLFLSLPLLAQQEETSRQLAHLRRHAILVTAGLFALLAAVGTRLARNFTRPITELVEGTRRIAAGARSLDLAPTELELAALVAAVDDMARRIAEGREGLLREKQVVERVVENIASGVVSLDRERRVVMHNRVAAELLGVAVGQRLEPLVARSERLAPVAAFLRSAGGEMARATVRLGGTGSGEREWSLVWVPLPGQGEPFALLVVEDATEELRGQRLLAWAAMARMIAHEIKNPLTPLRLSAEHMREVYHHDRAHFGAVFERCTTNILNQVEELRSIASEFSTYSAIPRIDPQPGDLTAAIAELVEGYRAAPPRGVVVDLEAPSGAIQARFDAKLLPRAVRNLIENALRASAGGGHVVVQVARDGATTERNGATAERDGGGAVGSDGGGSLGRGGDGSARSDGSVARIAVLDSGPGVPPDLLPRIFDPYFSTHDTGTGLGLPIARRIAEEHGGEISAHNRPAGGLEVAITIPCAPPAAAEPRGAATGAATGEPAGSRR
jgi:signal transduction histidine kinase